MIDKAPRNVEINYKGHIEPGSSAKTFIGNHCLFFPTLSENYGHVIVEAMASGCPVVISKGTTPWDDVDGSGGFVADLAKEDDFVSILQQLTECNCEEYRKIQKKLCEYAKHRLDIPSLKEGYIKMFSVTYPTEML